MQQCSSHIEIGKLCFDVCAMFQADPNRTPPWQNVALLLGTVAVETGFMRKVDPRSGLGLFNLGISDCLDVFDHGFRYRFYHPSSRRSGWRLFIKAWLGISSPKFFMPTIREMRTLLVRDDRFACCMAMWFYLGTIDHLGDSITDIANHWGRVSMAFDHHHDPNTFLAAWSERDCQKLMYGIGYR